MHYGIDSSEDVSNTWYAANQGGGAFTAQSAASGLAALVAAAKVSSDQWTLCVFWFANIRAVWSLLNLAHGFSGTCVDFALYIEYMMCLSIVATFDFYISFLVQLDDLSCRIYYA